MMNPSRPRSNRLLARSGWSLRVLIAFIEQKDAYANGVIAASLPPAIMTSASPRLIAFAASPRAWVPDAQADTTPKFGPRAPTSIATRPEHMFPMSEGMVKGDTLRGP